MALPIIPALTVAAVAIGIGAVAGWWIHKFGESNRLRAHEAYCRELVRVAAAARERKQNELDEIESRWSGLRGQHERCEVAQRELQEALAHARDERDRALDRARSAEQEFKGTRLALDEREGLLATLETDSSRLQSGMAEQERELKDHVTELKRKLATESARTRDFAGRIEERSIEVERLTAELNQIRREHAKCGETIRGLEADVKKLNHLCGERAGRVQETAGLRAELKRVRDGTTRLQQQLEEQTNRSSDLEADLGAAGKRRADDERTILELGERIAGLQRELQVRDRELTVGAPSWLLRQPPTDIDDLKAIRGLGPVLEKRLNALGIYQYRQLARLTAKEACWVAARLQITAGQIEREAWAKQSRRFLP